MRRSMDRFDRRRFLRASGVCLALPALAGLAPRARGAETGSKRRLVAINLGLGFLSSNFTPAQAGRDYEATKYLQLLQDFREQFTVISGASHPNVDGGHHAERSFLTAAPHPGSPSFKNSVSVDQLAAEKIGLQTRFGSLALSTGNLGCPGRAAAWKSRPSPGRRSSSPACFSKEMRQKRPPRSKWLAEGRSILDLTLDNASSIEQKLGPRDRDKLDQYLTAVRETEVKLQKAEEWEDRPKPKTARSTADGHREHGGLYRPHAAAIRHGAPGPGERFDPHRYDLSAAIQSRSRRSKA